MNGRDQLVAKLPHPEHDDRRLEVDVGGGAEHLAQTAVNPAAENRRHASPLRKERSNISQQWVLLPAVGGADGGLDQGSFGLVESATNGRAEVDGVRGRSPQPRLVASIARAKAEDVQRVARAERELHVDATEV